jgi:hypothetical protein
MFPTILQDNWSSFAQISIYVSTPGMQHRRHSRVQYIFGLMSFPKPIKHTVSVLDAPTKLPEAS